MKKYLGFLAGKLGLSCSSFYSKQFIEGWFYGAGITVYYKSFHIPFIFNRKLIFGVCSRKEFAVLFKDNSIYLGYFYFIIIKNETNIST